MTGREILRKVVLVFAWGFTLNAMLVSGPDNWLLLGIAKGVLLAWSFWFISSLTQSTGDRLDLLERAIKAAETWKETAEEVSHESKTVLVDALELRSACEEATIRLSYAADLWHDQGNMVRAEIDRGVSDRLATALQKFTVRDMRAQ